MEEATIENTQTQELDLGVAHGKALLGVTQENVFAPEVVQAKAQNPPNKLKFQEPNVAEDNPSKIGKTLRRKSSARSSLSRSRSSSSLTSQLQAKSIIENQDVDVGATIITC